MSYHVFTERGQSFDTIRQGFLQDEKLPLANVLSEEEIERAFADPECLFGQDEDDVYTPALTLFGFLAQVIASGAGRSCNAAAEYIRSLCLALGIRAPSPDSGAYCRARAKLSTDGIQHLTYHVADALEARVPADWLWHGLHVKMVDGSTVMAPDTEDNQEVWPQASTQQPGLGNPILRFCVLISLTTGALCGFAEAPYQGKETGEPALLREMFDRLKKNDLLLGDACFCSFFMLALLRKRKVHVLVHQHQRRKTNFRQGRRLGPDDHVVEWHKPDRPEWMDQATYESLPETITVRELRIQIKQRGFRTKQVTLVTTLTNAKRYSREELGALYRQRWHVELDLRSLKVTMHLEDLRGQTPAMVRKEIWAHLLAYNLIRRTMAAAAIKHECQPRSISFAGALQTVSGSLQQASVSSPCELHRLAEQKLESIASHRVGKRPNRVEPRAVKRRPKKQKLLMQPRDAARAALLSSSATAT
jgi:putative transposase